MKHKVNNLYLGRINILGDTIGGVIFMGGVLDSKLTVYEKNAAAEVYTSVGRKKFWRKPIKIREFNGIPFNHSICLEEIEPLSTQVTGQETISGRALKKVLRRVNKGATRHEIGYQDLNW